MVGKKIIELKELRELRKISRKELASQLGVSPVSIWKWEGGQDMYLSNAVKIKHILDPDNEYSIKF